MKKALLGCAFVLALVASQTLAATLNEGFESGMPANWAAINHSSPTGEAWSVTGNQYGITPHAGIGFASARDESVDDGVGPGVGTIDNWLITPQMQFNAGDTLTFYARTRNHGNETLEVRLSGAGASTICGAVNGTQPDPSYSPAPNPAFPAYHAAVEANVGDFTSLLLSIDPVAADATNFPGFTPAEQANDFPTTWTQYTVTIPQDTDGRLAFRYMCYDGGWSDYSWAMAVDDVQVAPAPEPASLILLGMGGLALLRRRSAR